LVNHMVCLMQLFSWAPSNVFFVVAKVSFFLARFDGVFF
jgi:hypothetical protein